METDNYSDLLYVNYVLIDVVNQMETHKHDLNYKIDLIPLNNNESDYVKYNINQLNFSINYYNEMQQRLEFFYNL